MKPTKTCIKRAEALLVGLLPEVHSHDQALDHLFYITPNATTDLRLWSIAAALYILNEAREEGVLQ